jgi:hypothetical protein
MPSVGLEGTSTLRMMHARILGNNDTQATGLLTKERGPLEVDILKCVAGVLFTGSGFVCLAA